MVGAPNARTKVDNQQTAELNGSPGVDTHFVQLFGFSGTDTRAVTLGGSVTDDTHVAVLEGNPSSLSFGASQSSSRGFPWNYRRLSTDFRQYTGTIAQATVNVSSSPYRVYGYFLESGTNFGGDNVVRDDGVVFTPSGSPFRTFTDSSPHPGINAYTIRTNRYARLQLIGIRRTSDTHNAELLGTVTEDTHEAVLQGTSPAILEPKLLGNPPVDTHSVILNGNPHSYSFSSTGTQIRGGNILGGSGTHQGYRPDDEVLVRTITMTVEENDWIYIIEFEGSTTNSGGFIIRRANPPANIVSYTGRVVMNPIVTSTGAVGVDIFPQTASVGTQVQYNFIIAGNGVLDGGFAMRIRRLKIIPDTHAAVLNGSEPIDTHSVVMSGGTTPDTHSVVLNGSPPVDTHSVNLIGNVRGKSPIGGRLR